MVKDGLFRRDLYYRLNVFPVSMPPLRERQGDIPLLVENFLEKYGHKIGKRGLRVAPEAEALLLAHSWPGNIRELENVLENAVALSEPDPPGSPSARHAGPLRAVLVAGDAARCA